MKKISKLMIFVILILAMSCPVIAAYKQVYRYKTVNLPQDTTVRAYDNDEVYADKTDTSTITYTMYKIRITQPGYIRIRTSGATSSISIYKRFRNGADIDQSEVFMDIGGKKEYYIVLEKGTYYLHANCDQRFRWHFYPVKDATNYCRANAKALASGKTATVCFTHKREHSQWFALRTNTKRAITVTLTRMDTTDDAVNVEVYDAKGKLIAFSPTRGTTVRTKQLSSGKYYIRVTRDSDEDDFDILTGRLAQVSWK